MLQRWKLFRMGDRNELFDRKKVMQLIFILNVNKNNMIYALFFDRFGVE